MEGAHFRDNKILNHVTSSLKELILKDCSADEINWSVAFKRFPKIEHITMNDCHQNEITADSFKHNSNLSSLTIDYYTLPTGYEKLSWEFV